MTAQPIPLRRFYVYVLKNEAGEVFYVGCGTGSRMMQHLASSHNGDVNSRLCEAASGDERISAEVISWHSTKADAAEEEKRVIKSFPEGALVNFVHTARPRIIKPGGKRPGRPRGKVQDAELRVVMTSAMLREVEAAAEAHRLSKSAMMREAWDAWASQHMTTSDRERIKSWD